MKYFSPTSSVSKVIIKVKDFKKVKLLGQGNYVNSYGMVCKVSSHRIHMKYESAISKGSKVLYDQG